MEWRLEVVSSLSLFFLLYLFSLPPNEVAVRRGAPVNVSRGNRTSPAEKLRREKGPSRAPTAAPQPPSRFCGVVRLYSFPENALALTRRRVCTARRVDRRGLPLCTFAQCAQRFEEELDETRTAGQKGYRGCRWDHPSYGGNQPAHCRK